jgi:hypothetical protein
MFIIISAIDTSFLFGVFGDVRLLHATSFCCSSWYFGSYLRDALQEGSADAVACSSSGLSVFLFFLLGGLRCFFL